jgi:hypothetical protein
VAQAAGVAAEILGDVTLQCFAGLAQAAGLQCKVSNLPFVSVAGGRARIGAVPAQQAQAGIGAAAAAAMAQRLGAAAARAGASRIGSTKG